MKKLKIKYMKRRIYKLEISPAEVRNKFGDLRFRKTWEAAYRHYVRKQLVTTQQTQPRDNKFPIRPVVEKVVNRDRNYKTYIDENLSPFSIDSYTSLSKIKLKYIKEAIYKLGISSQEVSSFGNLKLRKTWEAAYEYYNYRYDSFNNHLTESEFQEKENFYKQAEINYKEKEIAKNSEIFKSIAKKVFQNAPVKLSTEKVKSCDRELSGIERYRRDKSQQEVKQLTLFDTEEFQSKANTNIIPDIEPPDPDDYPNNFEHHYRIWQITYPKIADASEKWDRGEISHEELTKIIDKYIAEYIKAQESKDKKLMDERLKKYEQKSRRQCREKWLIGELAIKSVSEVAKKIRQKK